MTKEEDFKLLKIQTCVLKVNIHCDGCKQKVKKLLQRIEGVYQVQIDAEQQKVTVSGSVDAATLIKKLVRSGKYAELWSQKTNNNQNQKQKNNNNVKDDKNRGQKQGLVKGLEVFKNQQKFPAFSSEEDDEYYEYDEDEEEEDEEMRFIRERTNHLQMLKQANDANNVKKGIIAKMNNAGNGNSGKKGNPNQNMVMKEGANGIDQKTLAAMKLNNAHLVGNESLNLGESKRASDIGAMMNLAGFNGNNNNGAGSATVVGGNSNGLGGFPAGSTASIPNGGFVTGQYPPSMLMNMNGFNNHPSSLMNMQARHAMQQQPQMMYHRSPFVPPNTGYHYNYNNYIPANYSYANACYPTEDNSAAHMFSDDNTTSSCSIM
ncbi:putative heavy metal-associated domain, HMA [Medicago truncatula]|uniref:Heavy metal-associated domain protein n=2 Tax=Medicago truncatula TaxID=3880 RepID=A0A072VR18_MEDTR|nr:heavy metal-associated isoprenylated plant protein 37 [Medicago truncatula]KEH44131.1 heavy metal-associated domain protein [Medicago truncatula]RHN82286.1 putative heavy metal-associated domain, HMA [Medicago truncatula]